VEATGGIEKEEGEEEGDSSEWFFTLGSGLGRDGSIPPIGVPETTFCGDAGQLFTVAGIITSESGCPCSCIQRWIRFTEIIITPMKAKPMCHRILVMGVVCFDA
jgi:hypothetical protein